MNDTSAQMQEKFEGMLLSKSPEERVRMACSLFDFSKKLVISSIKEIHPEFSEAQMRGEIFMRFYETDFDAATRNKIMNHLQNV